MVQELKALYAEVKLEKSLDPACVNLETIDYVLRNFWYACGMSLAAKDITLGILSCHRFGDGKCAKKCLKVVIIGRRNIIGDYYKTFLLQVEDLEKYGIGLRFRRPEDVKEEFRKTM